MSKFVKVDEIMGRMEVQEMLGCTDTQIDRWVYREKVFPKPFLTLRGCRLWEKSVIKAWAEARNTQLPLPVEPPDLPVQTVRSKLPSAKPVQMSDDERQALVLRALGG